MAPSESRGPEGWAAKREAPGGAAGAEAPPQGEGEGGRRLSLPAPSAQVGPAHSLNDVGASESNFCCFQTNIQHFSVVSAVLRDPDSNPYSLLEGEGEQADADIGDGAGGERRRRSRRRRNDQEPSVMDAATESDGQAAPSENGLGEDPALFPAHSHASIQKLHVVSSDFCQTRTLDLSAATGAAGAATVAGAQREGPAVVTGSQGRAVSPETRQELSITWVVLTNGSD